MMDDIIQLWKIAVWTNEMKQLKKDKKLKHNEEN